LAGRETPELSRPHAGLNGCVQGILREVGASQGRLMTGVTQLLAHSD
jgi:hypothetical protein